MQNMAWGVPLGSWGLQGWVIQTMGVYHGTYFSNHGRILVHLLNMDEQTSAALEPTFLLTSL